MDMREVNRNLLNGWIEKNGPNGLERLSLKAETSSSTIAKARAGVCPRRTITRKKIASAIGLSEDDLFPLVRASEEAS